MSKVQRSVPLSEREPIIDTIRPSAAAVSPLSGARPDSVATMERPNSVNARSSGEPIESSTGRSTGMRERERDRADEAARERRRKAGAEGPPGFALARHGVAVDHGRGGADMAGHPEQHRADEIRRGDHGGHAEQERHRGVLVHPVGERDQHRHADDAVEPGQHADREPDQDPDHENHQTRRLDQKPKGVRRRRCHVARHSGVSSPLAASGIAGRAGGPCQRLDFSRFSSNG